MPQERLHTAIGLLITGEGLLRERLKAAANVLVPLRPEDFSNPENAGAFQRIFDALTDFVAPPGGDGDIAHTVKRLSDKEVRRIAMEILDLYRRHIRGG